MSLSKKIVLSISVVFVLCACAVQTNMNKHEIKVSYPDSVKFAQFNVSFAHDGDPTENFERWVAYMAITRDKQDALIHRWRQKDSSDEDKALAERIIQIRNIAAIIQTVRPDVLLLNEFNNDGHGKDYAAIEGFQDNYLAHAQSPNSVNGGDLLSPIYYPFTKTYATNTGLHSGLDFNRNGYSQNDPNDAYGFGFYHGHYAFALLSKYQIDDENTRTFQQFKRKDLPEAVMPTVNVCDSSRKIPEGLACGDDWFTQEAWQNLRLSSKNHVDAPIVIPQEGKDIVINALIAHPTPPAFDTISDNNKYRNSEENAFWLYYLQTENGQKQNKTMSSDVIYDDAGSFGGFSGEHFVVMGDLNADAEIRTALDARFNGIKRLMSSALLNQDVATVNGNLVPTSQGAVDATFRTPHPYPNTRTSTFGARADYSVPSASLKAIDSGVYWVGKDESGSLLFNDTRIGKRGGDKEVSSDHRLVWVSLKLQ